MILRLDVQTCQPGSRNQHRLQVPRALTKSLFLLAEVVEKCILSPYKINDDLETSIKINPGSRHVVRWRQLQEMKQSAWKCAFVATGVYMSPVLSFRRKGMQQVFLFELPPRPLADVRESWWFQEESFVSSFRKFSDSSDSSKESPALLLFNDCA
jgi:hypothetical protein